MNLLTIFVFVLIIVLIYMVYKLATKTTTTVSGFSDASKTMSVPCDASSLANYGYSVWLYIDNWISTTASASVPLTKNIITRKMFSLYVDNATNNLHLDVNNNSTTCDISNIQLQKWINITISVYGNTVDMYLDGKLVRTCVLAAAGNLVASDMLFVGGATDGTSKGDLQGYISNVVFKPDWFTPEEAWDIYGAGYSGSGMFDFIHKYKLNFSVTNNSETVGGFSI